MSDIVFITFTKKYIGHPNANLDYCQNIFFEFVKLFPCSLSTVIVSFDWGYLAYHRKIKPGCSNTLEGTRMPRCKALEILRHETYLKVR
jgi:hypothetical protein